MFVRMMLDSAERLLQLISETFSASARAFAFCLVEEFSHHMITDSSQPWEYTVCTMCTTHIDRRGIYAFTSPSLIFNHSTLWPKCFVAFYFGFPSSDDHAASCLVFAPAATIVVIVLQVFLQLLSNLMNVGSSAPCYCVHGSSQRMNSVCWRRQLPEPLLWESRDSSWSNDVNATSEVTFGHSIGAF